MQVSSRPEAPDMPEEVVAADRDRLRRGIFCSLALHGGLVVIWLLAGSAKPTALQEIVAMVPINLVPLVEETASPSQPKEAGLPQEKAAELPRKDQSVPAPLALAKKAVVLGKVSIRHEAPAQTDDFASRLQSLERTVRPPSVQRSDKGQGLSNVDAGDGRVGRMVGYGLQDAIREQIERRWEFDTSQLQSGPMVVSLHLTLNGGGEVLKAEIIDDSRYNSRGDYRVCAESARRAALASSPLIVPPGSLDELREVTVSLDPRRALR